tara:strand:+ start:3340 stop:5949 length:2610 start_codon:yes stop_codon:yes gene_type:complete
MQGKVVKLVLFLASGWILSNLARGNEKPVPERPLQILENYCLSCHDEVEYKGEINLDTPDINWDDPASTQLWSRVIKMVERGEMPPKKKKRPSENERQELVTWLDRELTEHNPIGGTAMRRLNKREFLHSINELFDIEYTLPEGFPHDNEAHGFDNQAEALVLSGPLLESYQFVATDLAEKLFPPPRKQSAIETAQIPAKDFTYAYSSGMLIDGAMRLVSNTPSVAHSASWPTHFEVKATGTYELTIDLSAFNPPEDVSTVADIYAVIAADAASNSVDKLRMLSSFHVPDSIRKKFRTEVILEKGETLVVHYGNGPISEDPKHLASFIGPMLRKEPELAAAFKQAGGKVARGRLGLDHLYSLIQAGDLPPPPVDEEFDQLVDTISNNKRSIAETLSYKLFEEGPALEIHQAIVHGPLALTDSKEDLYWKKRAAKLLGKQGNKSEMAFAREFLKRFLSAAFRRPVEKTLIEEYMELILDETKARNRIKDGFHLAIRTALTSPHFLYRGLQEGPLDSYDLASRLSYLLTSLPPDKRLLLSAKNDRLRTPGELEKQTLRLIESSHSNNFFESFLAQWLDLAELENLVPDANFFPKRSVFQYTEWEREAFIEEVHILFREVLNNNLPVEDLIDPDFTYTTGAVGRFIYGFPQFANSNKNDNKEMKRVSLDRGGRFGGVLGMAGVMTATANGVDTQPVLRGVWMLENILGDPPPPPPGSVPALTPDTSKAITPREMLAAHMVEESCAGCHKKIDPLGFVLESFDPIGRWRTHYPPLRSTKNNKKDLGLPIDTAGKLPNGTELRDITDLKNYLREDITPFAECISEKLLTYATGRAMNYSDHKLIKEVVQKIRANGGGFQDLVVALVNSESFRTR